jgi:hypothetical protein
MDVDENTINLPKYVRMHLTFPQRHKPLRLVSGGRSASYLTLLLAPRPGGGPIVAWDVRLPLS